MTILRSSVISVFVLVMALNAFSLVSQAQEIPAGVRYKRASDKLNNEAKVLLENALSSKSNAGATNAIFGKTFACGPLLWNVIKENTGDKFQGSTPMVLVINSARPFKMEGRGINQSAQQQLFWKLFIERVKGDNSFSIRKAKSAEIAYYWATIPFDIEEPFWIIDFGNTSVLVNFVVTNGEPKILWIDIVGDLAKMK